MKELNTLETGKMLNSNLKDKLFESMIQANPNAILLVDSTGKVLISNDKAVQFFGYTKDEFIKINVDSLIPKRYGDHSKHREDYKRNPTDRSMGAGRDLTGIRKNGEEFPIEVGLSSVEIENERFVIATITDISKRKKTHERFREALDVSWAYVEFDVEGNVLEANDKFITTFGYSSLVEIKGKHHKAFCENDYANSNDYKQFWKDLAKGLPKSGEFRRKSKNGSRILISASYTPIKDENGCVIKIMKIASDVSEKAEIASRFKQALDQSWAYIEFDPYGYVLEANSNFAYSLGYRSERALTGMHHSKFCFPDTVESKEYARFWADLRNGESVRGEYKRKTKRGKEIWLNAAYTPIKDRQGRVVKVMKIASDITTTVNQRIEVENTKNKLQISLDAGKTSLWELDLENGYARYDTNFHKLTGYKLGELPSEYRKSNILFRDGEFERMDASFKQALSRKQKEFDIDLQLTKKDDRVIWIRSFLHIEYENGKAFKVFGASQDITKQKNYEKDLQQKVEERTREVQQALQDLEASQEQLVESEKMASLGQLIAGIAHEINTPMGAIKATVENLIDMNDGILERLPWLVNYYKTKNPELYVEFLESLVGNKPSLTTREERKFKRSIKKQVEEKGYPNPSALGDFLGDLLFTGEFDKYDSILADEKNLELLEIASFYYSRDKGAHTINLATDKCRKIVFALKSFSRVDYSGDFKEMDLKNNLDTVLVLYENQTKHGVEVNLKYDENIPPLLAMPDALNQVWTNLIHNALQAMDNKGTLTVKAKNKKDHVLISINDTGCGIPEEIQDKIFKVFFTTKKAGEGSGLGLDIVRKIVEKHAGKIYVESEPGNTTFFVEIPKKEFILNLIEQKSKENV